MLVNRSVAEVRGMYVIAGYSTSYLSTIGSTFVVPATSDYTIGFESRTANNGSNWVEIQACIPTGS
jgi:hypothetical protein